MIRQESKLLLIGIVLSLFGCVSFDKGSEQAEIREDSARIRVAARPPVRWSDIATLLQPSFNLDSAQALREAIAPTQQVSSQIFDLLGWRLALGGSERTTSYTSDYADGITKETRQEKKTAGAIPPHLPAAPDIVAKVPGVLARPDDLRLADPALQYHAATALYQRVKFVDNYFRLLNLDTDTHHAFLLPIEIGLHVAARKLPADAYVTIDFIPGSDALKITKELKGKSPAVSALPVVASDAIEVGLVNQSLDRVRRAALQAGATLGTVGISTDIEKGVATLDQNYSTDVNALITTSYYRDASIAVRLAANQDGKGRSSLQSRTHTVFVVLFLHKEIRHLRMIARSHLVNINNGQRIDRPFPTLEKEKEREKTQDKELRGEIEKYGFKLLEKCPYTEHGTGDDSEPKYESGNLIRLADRQEYWAIAQCLTPRITDKSDQVQIGYAFERLLQELRRRQADSAYSINFIEIPPALEPTLPVAGQSGILLDDGKKSATVRLRGSVNLDPMRLHVSLDVKKGEKAHQLAASRVVADNSSQLLDVEFPSLKVLDVKVAEGKPMRVVLLDTDRAACKHDTYAVILPKDPTPENIPEKVPLFVGARTVVSSHTGEAVLRVAVGKAKKQPEPIFLIVTGADATPDLKSKFLVLSDNGIKVVGTGDGLLRLTNVSPSHPISLWVANGNGARVSDVIHLGVERLLPIK